MLKQILMIVNPKSGYHTELTVTHNSSVEAEIASRKDSRFVYVGMTFETESGAIMVNDIYRSGNRLENNDVYRNLTVVYDLQIVANTIQTIY